MGRTSCESIQSVLPRPRSVAWGLQQQCRGYSLAWVGDLGKDGQRGVASISSSVPASVAASISASVSAALGAAVWSSSSVVIAARACMRRCSYRHVEVSDRGGRAPTRATFSIMIRARSKILIHASRVKRGR